MQDEIELRSVLNRLAPDLKRVFVRKGFINFLPNSVQKILLPPSAVKGKETQTDLTLFAKNQHVPKSRNNILVHLMLSRFFSKFEKPLRKLAVRIGYLRDRYNLETGEAYNGRALMKTSLALASLFVVINKSRFGMKWMSTRTAIFFALISFGAYRPRNKLVLMATLASITVAFIPLVMKRRLA